MSQKDNNVYRYERKWVFDNASYIDVFNKALKSKFLFVVQHPKRHINSLYLDDFKRSSIIENLNGTSERTKVRVRWYGKNQYILNKPKLEIKIKKNFLNYKKIFPLNNLNKLNVKNRKDVRKICYEVEKTLRKKNLVTSISTHYQRIYLVSRNKKIRATIDYQMKGSNFNYHFQNPIFMHSKNLILELKYNKEFDGYVRKNIQNISSRFSKNSKYVNFGIKSF